MITADDFSRPKEWIPEEANQIAMALREFGRKKILPVRKQIDDDWDKHEIVMPLIKELVVDFKAAAAPWPVEVGGLDAPFPCTIAAISSEEISRFDSGLSIDVKGIRRPVGTDSVYAGI